MKNFSTKVLLVALCLTVTSTLALAGGMQTNKARLLNTNSRQNNMDSNIQKIDSRQHKIDYNSYNMHQENENVNKTTNDIKNTIDNNIQRNYNIFNK